MTIPDNGIYLNLADAKEACRQYLEAFYALQERFHITESCDDSGGQTYIHVRYLNDEGVVSNYTHW